MNNLTINPGDIIEFAGDQYLVLENWGSSGKVKEYPGDTVISPFYWEFEGEAAKVVPKPLTAEEASAAYRRFMGEG